MRKRQQQQILELLQTIKQAQSAGLYADCQEGAISIGSFIERLEGEGTRTVTLLEEYCELLFKVSNGEISEKLLRKHLFQIENSVKSELNPDKIEIVFLSYKASMSDSLESIYLAAKEDPDCDAFWIPVPYFERNADGSLGTMHYEGADCYGTNIECADWQQYDFEIRYPDVVFTFAPYDAGNYITSIHPNFYCERLRNFTDLLIYIPYFVAVDDVQEHFCTVAGCVFAHKVVLQSEKIRDTYVRIFKEAYGNGFGKPEDKFIALGSPKYDKVLNTKREDCKLPQDWRELIGDKKVIFYNTSIGSLLEGNEQYLQKLRYVLGAFRNRDDVVLWWRPHPLNEATYKAMRPQLLDEYEQIIADYKRSGWGIYDNTFDLHRALAWSDGYYGDMSSIVSLYYAIGKPLLLDSSTVSVFENFYDDGEQFWFTDYLYNALVRIDKSTWEAEYIGIFRNEKLNSQRLYTSTVEMGGKLYFTPFSANTIAVFDKATRQFDEIKMDCCPVGSTGYNEKMKFYSSVKYENWIFFIPFSFPGIVRYDTASGELDCFWDWREDLERRMPKTDAFYFKGAIVLGHCIYAAAASTNAVLVFDMKSNQSTLHTVGEEGFCYSGICYDGVNFWLAPRFGTACVKWCEKTGQYSVFELSENTFSDGSFLFNGVAITNGNVFILPYSAAKGMRINIQTEKIYPFVIGNDTEKLHNQYFMAQAVNGRLYAYEGSTFQLIEYDYETDRCRTEKIEIFSLTSFIHMLVQDGPAIKLLCERSREAFSYEDTQPDGTAGSQIYAYAKRFLQGAVKKR